MKAHMARLGITVIGLVLAIGALMLLAPAWYSWLAAAVIFLVGGAIGERRFQRLADLETRRRDLEDRVRNPLT